MTAISDPFKVQTFADAPPRPARLSIIEQHKGPKFDHDRPIVPNAVRVNGVLLHCPVDDPIRIREIRIDGSSREFLTVHLRLQARALRLGDAHLEVPAGGTCSGREFAVVELPELATGADAEVPQAIPYAVVGGMKIQLGGDVLVDAGGKLGDGLVVVELPMVCRSVVFDDEVIG